MDGELHFSGALVSAYEDGSLSIEQVVRVVLSHLEVCPKCAEEMDRWRETSPAEPTLPLFSMIRRGRFTAEQGERETAEREFEEILSIRSVDEQLRKVARANKRFRSPQLAQLLLHEAWGELALDSEKAATLIDLADLVLARNPLSARGRELRVFALSLRAAAVKASGDLEGAGRTFARARALAEDVELSDVRLLAHLELLEGSYLKDRRRLAEAENRLRHALRLYELLADGPSIARTRLTLALCVFHAGRAREAAALTEGALRTLDPDEDLLLYFAAHHNLTLYLAEGGRPREAAARLRDGVALYTEMSQRMPLATGHFNWLAGKVRRELGEHDRALGHLAKARAIFLDKGTRYEVVLICLDQALVHLMRKEPGPVKDLVGVMLPSLAADDLHTEALAAVRLLAEAARHEVLTSPLLREAYRFLEVARADPTLSFSVYQASRTF